LKIAVVVPVEVENPQIPAAKGAEFVFLLKGSPKDYVSETERKEAEARMQGNFRTQSRCNL
jgi:hypothetical protein